MALRATGWWVLVVLGWFVALLSSRYLALDPSAYFEEQRDIYMRREAALVAHIAASIIALLIGPWQLAPRVRRGRLRLHRAMGRVYAVAVLVGALAGLVLAASAYGGIVSTLGFTGLALSWLATTFIGVRVARAKQLAEHRRWMQRSYALCCAAITLRIYVPLSMALDLDFDLAYPAIAWLCWVPNIAVVLLVQQRAAAKH